MTDRRDWAGARVDNKAGDLHGTAQGPPNDAGNVLVVWDDGERTWSQARLLTVTEERRVTPPQIVARAPRPTAALAAFIAQELEHWGFGVEMLPDGRTLKVAAAEGVGLKLTVRSLEASL